MIDAGFKDIDQCRKVDGSLLGHPGELESPALQVGQAIPGLGERIDNRPALECRRELLDAFPCHELVTLVRCAQLLELRPDYRCQPVEQRSERGVCLWWPWSGEGTASR